MTDVEGRTIRVQATCMDDRVALWERHPAHPEGEVFIAAGMAPQWVGLTAAVLRALADGRLREVPDVAAAVVSFPVPEPRATGKRAKVRSNP